MAFALASLLLALGMLINPALFSRESYVHFNFLTTISTVSPISKPWFCRSSSVSLSFILCNWIFSLPFPPLPNPPLLDSITTPDKVIVSVMSLHHYTSYENPIVSSNPSVSKPSSTTWVSTSKIIVLIFNTHSKTKIS